MIVSVLAVLVSGSGLFADNGIRDRFQSGLHLTPGFPLNGFKDNLDRTIWGGDFFFLWRIPGSIFSMGASLGIHGAGYESRREAGLSRIPEIVVKVGTSNCVLLCHFILRVQPRRGAVRPYLDGLAGFNYLWTETSVSGWREMAARSVNLDDTAFSYGAGAGLTASLLQEKTFSLALDLGVRFLKGGTAEFLTKGSVFDVKSSPTDLATAHIGVAVVF